MRVPCTGSGQPVRPVRSAGAAHHAPRAGKPRCPKRGHPGREAAFRQGARRDAGMARKLKHVGKAGSIMPAKPAQGRARQSLVPRPESNPTPCTGSDAARGRVSPPCSALHALPAAAASLAAPARAAAAPAMRISPGDIAWVLVCTALVLLMTIPGLALFYAGMVRKKNVLATMMQSFSLCALVSVVWMVAGYSLAFTNGDAWIGELSRLFLNGLGTGWDQAVHARRRQRRGAADDDPGKRLRDVPDGVRHHHPGGGHRRLRRPDEVLGAAAVHDAVVAAGLRAGRTLGVGRRPAG